MSPRGLLLVVTLAACRAQPATHTLWMGGQPVATATAQLGPREASWRFTYALQGGPWVQEASATLSPDGHLLTYDARSGSPGDWQREVHLQVDPALRLSVRVREADSTLDDTVQLTAPLVWPLSGHTPPDGPALVWDGHQVRRALAQASPGGWQLTSGGQAWSSTQQTWRFADGSTLRAGVADLSPVDPVALLSVPTEALPGARNLRRVTWHWPGLPAPLPIDRPLAAEVPVDAQTAPPASEDPQEVWTLPEPLPAPKGRLAATSRRKQIDEAFDRVRRQATASSAADCQPLSRAMVSLLRAEGVPAEVVRGWLYVDDPSPRLVRHAWVRVWVGGPLGWLAVDAALGQRIADPTHLSDALVGPALPDGLVRHSDARGPG